MLLRTEFKNRRNKIGNNNDDHCEVVINKKKVLGKKYDKCKSIKITRTLIDPTMIPHEYFLMRQRYDQCFIVLKFYNRFFSVRLNISRAHLLWRIHINIVYMKSYSCGDKGLSEFWWQLPKSRTREPNLPWNLHTN